MAGLSAAGSAFGPWGALAGAAADYYLDEEGRRKARDEQKGDQIALNRQAIEQEKASIIGRVDAAKAAGIHPLVALGAQGLGGPVLTAPAYEPTRFNVDTSSFRQQGDADIERYNRARADLAEIEVQLAAQRLASQPGNGGAPNQIYNQGKVVPDTGETYPVSTVAIQGQTLPPASASVSYQTPGVSPGWDVVAYGNGLKMVVPGGSVQRENWGEQMGELPFWMMPEVVRQSAAASKMSVAEWLHRAIGGNEQYDGGVKATKSMAILQQLWDYFRGNPRKGAVSSGRVSR